MSEITNAIITRASIFIEDHGMLTAYLYLDYGGSGQGFGGHCLYLPKTFKHHNIHSVAGHFIYRCLEIADVDSWDKLPGKTVRAEYDWDHVHRIGHIVKDIWFVPKEEFK